MDLSGFGYDGVLFFLVYVIESLGSVGIRCPGVGCETHNRVYLWCCWKSPVRKDLRILMF